MKDAEGVRRLQAIGNLDADGEQKLRSGRATLDELIERLAGHILHDDVALVAGLAHFVDGADVGVLDGGGEAGFAQDGGAELLRREQAGAQNFEHDGALQIACRWPDTPRRCRPRQGGE